VAIVCVLVVMKHVSAAAALDVQLVAQQMALPPEQSQVLFPVVLLLYIAALVNLSLFIFNLIPVPPLDGSHVLRHFLPYNAGRIYDSFGIYGFMVVFFILPFALHINIFWMLFAPARLVFQTVLLAA